MADQDEDDSILSEKDDENGSVNCQEQKVGWIDITAPGTFREQQMKSMIVLGKPLLHMQSLGVQGEGWVPRYSNLPRRAQ